MSEIPQIGQIFDAKYKIEELLGSGGNGSVFKALQLDCNRVIALKVLHDFAKEQNYDRVRFIREAQALSKISHPNIVTIYNLGISSSNVPYMAMEHVEGESLRSMMNSTDRLPVLRSLRIIRQAAMAMAYVHQSKNIHRDLKPENIIITQVPDPDTVKIIDFGLVKLTQQDQVFESEKQQQQQQQQQYRELNQNHDQGHGEGISLVELLKEDQTPGAGGLETQEPEALRALQPDQKLTVTGQLMGSIKYMSPEQCMGKAVDFRTDIYSLSCILYEMIVGKPPFDADNPIGLAYKHINQIAPKIEHGQVDLFHPELADLIAQGLSKDPQQRFANMQEMENKIAETIAILSIKSSSKPLPASRAHLIGIAILLALIICSSIIFAAKLKRPTNEKANTPLLQKKKNLNEDDSEWMLAIQKCEGMYREDDPKLASRLISLAGAHPYTLKPARGIFLYQRVLAIYEKIMPATDPRLVEVLCLLARWYKQQENFKEAESLLQRALQIREQNPTEKDDPSSLSCLPAIIIDLEGCYKKMANYHDAVPLLKRALKLKQFSQTVSLRSESKYLHLLAGWHLLNSKRAEAEPLLKRALALEEKKLNPEPNLTADIVFDLVTNYPVPNAATLARKSTAILEDKYKDKPEDPRAWTASIKFARFYREQKNQTEFEYFSSHALAAEEKALEIAQRKKEYDQARAKIFYKAQYDLALNYLDTGHNQKAESLLKQVLKSDQHLFSRGNLQYFLALSISRQRRAPEAETETMLKQALALEEKETKPDISVIVGILENLAGPFKISNSELATLISGAQKSLERAYADEYPRTTNWLFSFARICEERKLFFEAIGMFEHALAIEKASFPAKDPEIVRCNLELARCCLKYGQFLLGQERCAEAGPNYKRAAEIFEENLAKSDPELGDILFQTGYCFNHVDGQNLLAQTFLRRAVAISEKRVGKEDPRTRLYMCVLAETYLHSGNTIECEKTVQYVLPIVEQKLRQTNFSEWHTSDSLVSLLLGLEKNQEAQRLMELTIAASKEDGIHLARFFPELATAYMKDGKSAEAEVLLKRALKTMDASLAPNHPAITRCRNLLAQAYIQQGKSEEANAVQKLNRL